VVAFSFAKPPDATRAACSDEESGRARTSHLNIQVMGVGGSGNGSGFDF
jgi:hypothetical protein